MGKWSLFLIWKWSEDHLQHRYTNQMPGEQKHAFCSEADDIQQIFQNSLATSVLSVLPAMTRSKAEKERAYA